MRRIVFELEGDRHDVKGEVGLDNDGNLYLMGADGKSIKFFPTAVDVPFDASNFAAFGGGSWTVAETDIVLNRLIHLGNNVYRWFLTMDGETASVVAGTPTRLGIYLPNNLRARNVLNSLIPSLLPSVGNEILQSQVLTGGDHVEFLRLQENNFIDGDTYITGIIEFEAQ